MYRNPAIIMDERDEREGAAGVEASADLAKATQKRSEMQDKDSDMEPPNKKRAGSSNPEPSGSDGKLSTTSSKQSSTAAAASFNAAANKGTYPKPKNFAERMMHALENGVDSKVIYWYEEGEEDLIAINSKFLKDSDILESNFQGIRYAAFVRNLSRWGFRKAYKSRLPDGLIVYRNSLFQKDNPHLVRHMKIDSDVQDIFGQHQKSSKQPSSSGSALSISGPQAASQLGGQLPWQTHQLQRPPQHQQGMSGSQASQGASLDLLRQFMSNQGSQPLPRPLPPQQQQVVAALGVATNSAGRSQNDILEEIVTLSEQFLTIAPPAADSPTFTSIHSLLRLLIGLGNDQIRAHRELQQRQQQEQQQRRSDPPAPLLQELLLSMTQQQQQPQQRSQMVPPSQQQQQSQPTSLAGLAEALKNATGGQSQQSSTFAGLAEALQNATGQLQNATGQQQPQQDASSIPPALLLQLAQLQQQQQQRQNQGNN